MRAILVAAVLSIAAASPAQACIIALELDPALIERADAVVVGRLTNYEIVEDQAARERRRRQIEDRNTPPEMRRILRNADGYVSDYARFQITVRETLRGRAPRTITVTWDNSTFSEPPSLANGEYLVALSARTDRLYAVLQSPCRPAFLFRSNSAQARDIRRRLRDR